MHQSLFTALPDQRVAVDMRQSSKRSKGVSRQKAVGACCVTLLSQSKVYVYGMERTLVPEEHFEQQGWFRPNLQRINWSVPGYTPKPRKAAPKPKPKAKAKANSHMRRATDTKMKDLAGNMMCVPDLSLIVAATVP